MDKILVLMSTFNGEKYLQEQLDSIYNQHGVKIDVLVRDDGSNDNTCNILDENAKKYNIKWYGGENIGVANSFFDLMLKASNMDYKYFAFSDQDDVWDSNKLLLGVNEIKKCNSIALYYCGQSIVDENLVFIENHFLNRYRSNETRFILSDFAGCTGVFNINLLNEVVKYFPKYMLMHDTWILRVCLCLGGKIIVDCKPHIKYRQHGKNSIGLKHNIISNTTRALKYIFEYKIQDLTSELYKGYGNVMCEKYKILSNYILNYKKSWPIKKKLLNSNFINFNLVSLNIIYRIKVLFNLL